ncbi:MAG: hypothetical protein ACD_11C00090G0007 [uncultured bacterium]|nr:MAG: hypothetical protein ACD_11C00090G0007 [uncultured bacterium]HBR71742.1 hypothetical protein [Candidatus Moranbacteria bacterium]
MVKSDYADEGFLKRYQETSGRGNIFPEKEDDGTIGVFTFLGIVGGLVIFFCGFAFYGLSFLKVLA